VPRWWRGLFSSQSDPCVHLFLAVFTKTCICLIDEEDNSRFSLVTIPSIEKKNEEEEDNSRF
jgi:hypothetical protein